MSTPTILIIVGITGDLAKRKLLPAIEQIAQANELPAAFRIVGVTRQAIASDQLLEGISSNTDLTFVKKHLELFQMDLGSQADYQALSERLVQLKDELGGQTQELFYLSVPPQISRPIIEHLGKAGLAKKPTTKLLLEKPFGSDLVTATELIQHIKNYFNEQQIYRIDHYLAKEMAQNLLVFRNENSLFKRTWNTDFIERITITASEKIGIEGRAAFYEQTGALRDLVQSHLLQLAALTLMQLPPRQAWQQVPAARLAALQDLQPPEPATVVRAQYEGYRDEVGNKYSSTETFVSMTLFSSDPRWTNVPITLVTGKNLKEKATTIQIHYRQENAGEANQLTLRIQPKEGIEVSLWGKSPGYNRQLEQVHLRYAYHEAQPALPEAYEQVLLDAIRSDHTLFVSSDEVLASWRLLEQVQNNWDEHPETLQFYRPGTSTDKLR